MKKFFKTLWSIIWPLGLYLLVAMMVEAEYSLYLIFREYYETGVLNMDNIINAAVTESLGTTAIVSAITIIICFFIIRSDRKKHAYDSETGNANITFAAIIASIGACLLGNYLIAISGIMDSDEAFDLVNEVIMSAPIWIQVLTAVILGPVCEEMLFRGIVYKRIEYNYGFWPAAIVSSLLFGALHGNISQFIYASALGLLFAYAYRKSGKLWVCILMHITANAASMIFELVSAVTYDYIAVEIAQILAGILLLAAGLATMIKTPSKLKKS